MYRCDSVKSVPQEMQYYLEGSTSKHDPENIKASGDDGGFFLSLFQGETCQTSEILVFSEINI